jgi:hypothetical protein
MVRVSALGLRLACITLMAFGVGFWQNSLNLGVVVFSGMLWVELITGEVIHALTCDGKHE